MKTILCLLFFSFTTLVSAQSIIGHWQLLRESNCLEEKVPSSADSTQRMVDEMKSMSSASPLIVKFKDKMAGEESMRILTKRKTVNDKNFLYKFDGEMLLILDKKSRTITDSFTVEKLDADSLILSNVSRPCETRIFKRIK
jgi:hypothetical protein